MDERIAHLQERHFMERADFLGVDYPSLYMCKPKRGLKREDGGKDAYKLPHRLIEKKRRDRINECIGQLKDLLPEHLKLSTLGHLEKAVVLELTLKHLNALTAVTEQQHQKIIALQNGDRSMKSSIHTNAEAFHSGFQTCVKEVLQYLSQFENWTAQEQSGTQLVQHLHKVLARVQSGSLLPQQQQQQQQQQLPTGVSPDGLKADNQANCVPVIQRTQGGDLTENDTDTDSGYGGEGGKDKECEHSNTLQAANGVKIKQEFGDDRPAKKPKMNWSGNGSGAADVAFMNSLMGLTGVGQQTPICMPFYFINPSAAASYMPLFDKSNMEKSIYPAATLASPFPWLYPAQASAAAAAAAFPGLSAHLGASSPCKDPQIADDVDPRDGEMSSPDEREETPTSDDGDDDEESGIHRPCDQLPVCQS